MKEAFGVFYSVYKRYEGTWKDGKQHGKGVIAHDNGKIIYIEYYEGKKVRIVDQQSEITQINKVIEEERKKIDVEKYLKTANKLMISSTANNNDILSGNSFDSGIATNNTNSQIICNNNTSNVSFNKKCSQ